MVNANDSQIIHWSRSRKEVEKKMLSLHCQSTFDGFFSNPIVVFYEMLLKKPDLMANDWEFDGQKNIMLKASNQLFAYKNRLKTQQSTYNKIKTNTTYFNKICVKIEIIAICIYLVLGKP